MEEKKEESKKKDTDSKKGDKENRTIEKKRNSGQTHEGDGVVKNKR